MNTARRVVRVGNSSDRSPRRKVLECVVNVSEGRRPEVLTRLGSLCGPALLDLHCDPFHHRSVFTLAGTEAVRHLTTAAVGELDLATHTGVHPRLGVVDVVPFVPLPGSTLADAIAARDSFARWASSALGVPCFLYGPERTLPEVRRHAWSDLAPDFGPPTPHRTAGAICVGARPVLVAYNLYLRDSSLELAKHVASLIRGPRLRALGLQVGDRVQVSMNLIEPAVIGPAQAYDVVALHVSIAETELVGLITESVLAMVPRRRWQELDLSPDRTIDSRMRGALALRGPHEPNSW